VGVGLGVRSHRRLAAGALFLGLEYHDSRLCGGCLLGSWLQLSLISVAGRVEVMVTTELTNGPLGAAFSLYRSGEMFETDTLSKSSCMCLILDLVEQEVATVPESCSVRNHCSSSTMDVGKHFSCTAQNALRSVFRRAASCNRRLAFGVSPDYACTTADYD
jgi:hypothetical protein